MKPHDSEIAWAIENRDLVAAWLEERGGWQVGDWCVGIDEEQGQFGYVARWQLAHKKSGSHVTTWVVVVAPDSGTLYVPLSSGFVWLPGTGDVLGLLEERGILPMLVADRGDSGEYEWSASKSTDVSYGAWCETPLIALLELLKEVGRDE